MITIPSGQTYVQEKQKTPQTCSRPPRRRRCRHEDEASDDEVPSFNSNLDNGGGGSNVLRPPVPATDLLKQWHNRTVMLTHIPYDSKVTNPCEKGDIMTVASLTLLHSCYWHMTEQLLLYSCQFTWLQR